MTEAVIGLVKWKRESFQRFPWSLEKRHIVQLSEILRDYAAPDHASYQIYGEDGSTVYFSNAADCIKHLEDLPYHRRLQTLAIAGDNGNSQAVKVYLNRFLLTEIVSGELLVQYGTATYSVSSPTKEIVYSARQRIEDTFGDLRQTGITGAMAAASMHPLRWIVVGTAVSFVAITMVGGAELEVEPAGSLTYWMRDRADVLYLLATILGIVVVSAPYLLRMLYPFTVVRLGAEGRKTASLAKFRMVFFRYIFLGGLIMGVTAAIVGAYLYEHWQII